MMASIPNMRSTPLPVPTAKGAATEGASGDFASQMPAVRGQPVEPVPPVLQPPAENAEQLLPEIGEAILPDGEEGGSPDTEADTPEIPNPANAVQTPSLVVPFAPPAPQQLPTVAADETPPAETCETRIEATARQSAQTAGGKTDLPLPAVTAGTAKSVDEAQPKAPQPEAKQAEAQQPPAPQLEAAVKELLQRKQVLPKPAGPAPKNAGTDQSKPETAATPAPIQSRTPAPATPQPVVAIVAQAMPEPLQPLVATSPAQPEPLKTDAPRTVEGARVADVAVERQLDLARGGQWLDRLARDIAAAGANDGPLRFRLHPQTLGHLQVELQQGDHGTAVRLTVETEAARQLLADAQPRLAGEARAQGVRIAETHVEMSSSGRHAPGDQRRQDEARQANLIRTSRGAETDAVASARAARRTRLDRYA